MINKIKNVRWAWLTMLLLGIISVGITSCKNDDDDVNPDGVEKESGMLTTFAVETPSGRAFYMYVSEEIPSEVNVTNSIELGLTGFPYSYGEHAYIHDNTAKTITKWEFDKTTLEPNVSAILSFASTGLKSGSPTFISDEQAFIFDFEEGLALEWNPSTMDIISMFNFDKVPFPDGIVFWGPWESAVKNGKIVLPLIPHHEFCCEFKDFGGATIAVFDPSTKTISYNQDNRLLASESIVRDESDNIYLVPSRNNGFARQYLNLDGNEELNPFTVLRLDNDGGFDNSFAFDLEKVIPVDFVAGGTFVRENKLVVQYMDTTSQWAASFDDRWSIYGSTQHNVSIDLETNEVTPFTALADYSFAGRPATIDGITYWMGLESGVAVIIREDDSNSFTTISSSDDIYVIENLFKLW
ncbi:MAG: hypothetical protein AAF600_21070 [Bacteroidota bacterium]